jgi:L-tyrosine isonitrile synthase
MKTLQNETQTLNATFTKVDVAFATVTAKAILAEVMRFRRGAACTCEACVAPHLPKLIAKIVKQEPVTFVLPAFPGKSPNLAKVLGTLPDMAEERALEFLQRLSERIGRIYAPGAQVIMASDGRVFSDAVGMRDEDVSAYRDALLGMVKDLGLTAVTTFNLEDLYAGLTFDEMRVQMMDDFGASLDELQASVRAGAQPDASADDIETHRLYVGITRFLVEDSSFPGQTKSRNQLQKEARVRAYEVIQRSQAWSGVVAREFPDAVRLSIHPHGCGSAKLGIMLSEDTEGDSWLTPWHGVALEVNGRFLLTKRSQAEALGARLVSRFGRPSHFTLDA